MVAEEGTGGRYEVWRVLPRRGFLLLQFQHGEKCAAKLRLAAPSPLRRASGCPRFPRDLRDPCSTGGSAKGMLETQIDEHGALPATAADTERKCDAGNDL